MSQDDTSQSFVDFKHQITAVPIYGLKFKFDKKFPEKENFSQNLKPSWKQIWNLVPMMMRYVPYYWKNSRSGLPILMDYFSMQNSLGIYGVPLGGIGAGELTLKYFSNIFFLNRLIAFINEILIFVIRINRKGICWRILPISVKTGNLRVQHRERKSVYC